MNDSTTKSPEQNNVKKNIITAILTTATVALVTLAHFITVDRSNPRANEARKLELEYSQLMATYSKEIYERSIEDDKNGTATPIDIDEQSADVKPEVYRMLKIKMKPEVHRMLEINRQLP